MTTHTARPLLLSLPAAWVSLLAIVDFASLKERPLKGPAEDVHSFAPRRDDRREVTHEFDGVNVTATLTSGNSNYHLDVTVTDAATGRILVPSGRGAAGHVLSAVAELVLPDLRTLTVRTGRDWSGAPRYIVEKLALSDAEAGLEAARRHVREEHRGATGAYRTRLLRAYARGLAGARDASARGRGGNFAARISWAHREGAALRALLLAEPAST